MKLIIKIDPAYERILRHVFPFHSVVDKLEKRDNFILRQDICTPKERIYLTDNFNDFIVLSDKVFDELWNEEKIIEVILKFRRKFFGEKKRVLYELWDTRKAEDKPKYSRKKAAPKLEKEDFINACINYMFTGEVPVQREGEIYEVLDAYGTARFIDRYFERGQIVGYKKLDAAMMTFLSKILSSSTTAQPYYAKKKLVLLEKLNRNMNAAIENRYNCRKDSPFKELKFFIDLVQ